MTTNTLGIIVGGIIPALLFGFTNVFVKSASVSGASPAQYLLLVGLTVTVLSGICLLVWPTALPSVQASAYSVVAGLFWGIGVLALSFALQKGAAVSVVTPLYNMNTLVAVLLGLWFFAEWKQVQLQPLLIGSVLIVVGGVLVARA